ncbi:MAG: carboxypeptidase-like regulatory domain-containing protein, partial [Planctomycetes bacterium]|nr:carboxypeptidase-like regulatory domain-containing protein [Planctomycetota bacterium]
KTDTAGNFILYVNNGTWHVETDIPGTGWLEYSLPVTVSGAAIANIILSPSVSASYYTITGLVGIDTNNNFDNVETAFANLPIRAVKYDANGVHLGKEYNSTTNSLGQYTITVPEGIYRVDIWTPEYGEIGVNDQDNDITLNQTGAGEDDEYPNNPANVNATGGNVAGANIIVKNSDLQDVSLTFTNAQAYQAGYLNIEGVNLAGTNPQPNGFMLSRRIDNLAAGETIKLADGYYLMFLNVPGVGNFKPDISGVIDINPATSVSFTLLDLTTGAVTISGTVKNASNQAISNAWVWVGHPQSGYHNGTQTATTGAYTLIIPSGTGYKMGADKPGYMSGEPIDLNATASSTQNFILNTYAYSISGQIWADANSDSVFQATEAVPNGFVRAETTRCSDAGAAGVCVKAHTPVDGTGYYELGVTNGDWKVYGMASGFNETYYGSAIMINNASSTSKNIKLTANAGWSNVSKQKPITPASGGTLDDTAASGTKVKLVIPPNALGSSNSTGNVNAQKTGAVIDTNSTDPLNDSAVSVSASDNSGQTITNLDDYIDLEIVLYKADVDAAIAAGELTYDKLKSTNIAYWDSTVNDWVQLTTTRKAYYATTTGNWILYASSTDSFSAFIDEIASSTLPHIDYKMVYSGKTNHLTIFAVIMPFIAEAAEPEPEPEPPAPVLTGGGGSFPSNCRIVEYGAWKGVCTEGLEYRDIISRTPTNCTLSVEQQNGQKRVCTIEAEDKDEPAVEETDVPTADEVRSINELYLEQGDLIWRAEVSEILPALGITERNHVGEQLSRGTLINRLKIDLTKYEPPVQYALTNFITYGSPDTVRLGWGERAGVLNSFMAAFGKVPAAPEDWSDIIKISNGRWPTQRSTTAETAATAHFKKISEYEQRSSRRPDL